LTISAKLLYKAEKDKVKKTKERCPKCGDGIYLATHKDRLSCGKCGYTIFKKK